MPGLSTVGLIVKTHDSTRWSCDPTDRRKRAEKSGRKTVRASRPVDSGQRIGRFPLAYNLANFLQRMALPREIDYWSLTTLREKLVKTGAKVVRHAKYVTFQLVEVAVPRRLFAAILDRITRLAMPPPEVTMPRV